MSEPAPVGDTRPFIVPAATLRKVAGTVRHEIRQGVIAGLGTVGVEVPEGAEVGVDLTLVSYPEGVMATGTVTAPWQGECRRCGGAVTGRVAVRVRERFARSGGSNDDEDAYPFADDVIDLEPLARDAVLLELPLAPLCAEGCRGLCPQCGADLNVETCLCEAPPDPRWSALAALGDAEGGDLGDGEGGAPGDTGVGGLS